MTTAAASVLVISGPSGVGKGTVIEQVRTQLPQLHVTVSATTRASRPGEVDGRDYHFLSASQFATRRVHGEMVEYAEYAGHWYGTLISELQRSPLTLVEADVRGAQAIRAHCPHAVTVFLAPPSFEVLHDRLKSRGTETEEQIERRLIRARQELEQAERYDHVLVCADANRTSCQIAELFESLAAAAMQEL